MYFVELFDLPLWVMNPMEALIMTIVCGTAVQVSARRIVYSKIPV